jgi:hypothetical protein
MSLNGSGDIAAYRTVLVIEAGPIPVAVAIGRRPRSIFLPARSVAFLSASLHAAAALVSKGRLHRGWADAKLLGDLPHAFSAARLVYSGADACFKFGGQPTVRRT